jgi:hypothetical protein
VLWHLLSNVLQGAALSTKEKLDLDYHVGYSPIPPITDMCLSRIHRYCMRGIAMLPVPHGAVRGWREVGSFGSCIDKKWHPNTRVTEREGKDHGFKVTVRQNQTGKTNS